MPPDSAVWAARGPFHTFFEFLTGIQHIVSQSSCRHVKVNFRMSGHQTTVDHIYQMIILKMDMTESEFIYDQGNRWLEFHQI